MYKETNPSSLAENDLVRRLGDVLKKYGLPFSVITGLLVAAELNVSRLPVSAAELNTANKTAITSPHIESDMPPVTDLSQNKFSITIDGETREIGVGSKVKFIEAGHELDVFKPTSTGTIEAIFQGNTSEPAAITRVTLFINGNGYGLNEIVGFGD